MRRPQRAHQRTAQRTAPAHGAAGNRGFEQRLLLAALVVLAGGSLVAVGESTHLGPWEDLRLTENAQWLSSMTAVLAGVIAVVSLMRWRLVGDAAAGWVGGALLLYSAAGVALPDFVLNLVDSEANTRSLTALVTPAGTLVVIAMFAVALVLPPGDRWFRPGVVAITAIGAVAVGVFVLRELPSVTGALARPPAGRDLPTSEMIGQSCVALTWLGLGAAYMRRGLRRQRLLYTWLGLTLLGFAEARVVLSLGIAGTATPTIGYIIRALALLFGLYGATRELQYGFIEQRDQLLGSLLDLETAETRLRAERAAGEERAHDLRNALLAVGGAAHTLELYYESLEPRSRASLARALATEIQRIQSLITPVHLEETLFDLNEMLSPLVACCRANGQEIALDVPVGLKAFGRPAHTAEVVQNLLDNARRYAPGSPLRVRARPEHGDVVVRVEDRGAGVPISERALIFERGKRGSRSEGVEGSGLGLYVSARLMEEQGGSLWVEGRRGGGASFALRLLPQAPPAATGGQDGARDGVRARLLFGGA